MESSVIVFILCLTCTLLMCIVSARETVKCILSQEKPQKVKKVVADHRKFMEEFMYKGYFSGDKTKLKPLTMPVEPSTVCVTLVDSYEYKAGTIVKVVDKHSIPWCILPNEEYTSFRLHELALLPLEEV